MSKRILAVEDQKDLRTMLGDFLSASGYTVIEAVARPARIRFAPSSDGPLG